MRCFVAIPLPKEIKDEVVRVQKSLQSLDLHSKWVEFANLHVTLKFLGELKEADLTRAKDIVNGISSFAQPFLLQLAGIGAFPDVRSPRVLWAGIKPQDNPVAIIGYLEEEFSRMGIPKEKRPPHPHITLARIKSPKNTHKLKDRLSDLEVEEISWEVGGVSLLKSTLTRIGPIYEEILKADLSA